MAAAARQAGDDAGEGRQRYYDSSLQATVVQVFQADLYVSSDPDEILTTVLGSCIAACVRDPLIRCGGMNHFLLPDGADAAGQERTDLALRYGQFAMEQLVNAVMAAGGRKDRLEVKVFGGANVIRGLSGIGHRNADFIEAFLEREGYAIAGKHLRGTWPRKVQFNPQSGQVRMREIKDKTASSDVFDQEAKLAPRHAVDPQSGSVELFD